MGKKLRDLAFLILLGISSAGASDYLKATPLVLGNHGLKLNPFHRTELTENLTSGVILGAGREDNCFRYGLEITPRLVYSFEKEKQNVRFEGGAYFTIGYEFLDFIGIDVGIGEYYDNKTRINFLTESYIKVREGVSIGLGKENGEYPYIIFNIPLNLL